MSGMGLRKPTAVAVTAVKNGAKGVKKVIQASYKCYPKDDCPVVGTLDRVAYPVMIKAIRPVNASQANFHITKTGGLGMGNLLLEFEFENGLKLVFQRLRGTFMLRRDAEYKSSYKDASDKSYTQFNFRDMDFDWTPQFTAEQIQNGIDKWFYGEDVDVEELSDINDVEEFDED